MKKVFKITISLLLTLIVSFSSFAVTVDENKTQNINVKARKLVTYDVPDVMSVDIFWGEMEFSYNVGEKNWNSTTHQYEEGKHFWTASGNTITIINHSNIPIEYDILFSADTNYDISGSLTNSKGTLALAEGRSYNDADKVVSTLSLSGKVDSTNSITVGKVNVKISKVFKNSLSLSFESDINIDLTNKKITFKYEHSKKSYDNIVLTLIINGNEIFKTDKIEPGTTITELDLSEEAKNLLLQNAINECLGTLRFTSYNIATNEKLTGEPEFMVTVKIKE